MAVSAVYTGPVVVGNAASILYTSTGVTTLVKKVTFSNVSGAPDAGAIAATAALITVYIGRAGAPQSIGNMVIHGQNVPTSTVYVAVELGNVVLGPGDSIYIVSSVSSALNATFSGLTL